MSSSHKTSFSVLVTGCSGFVGYHLLRHFVQDPSCKAVFGFSRSAEQSKRQVAGVKYFSGNISDSSFVQHIIEKVKPVIIVHAAAPSAITGTAKEYRKVIIEGTGNLVRLAKESPHVHALVYTSTALLGKGSEHINYTEECPRANTDPSAPAYSRAKATAEELVINANKPSLTRSDLAASHAGYLSTVALRFPIIYGTHDTSYLPGCLTVLVNNETNIQVGNGDNLWSFCSIENAVTAHSLAISAILHRQPTHVDGEIFNFHDGEPYLFWEEARKIWKMAGYVGSRRCIKIPVGVAVWLALITEFAFWVFTFGTRRPQRLGKQQVDYACYTHTYSIQKAKERLGFSPKQNHDEALKDAVDWFLNEDGWRQQLSMSMTT